jgi:hypothetical protein
MWICRLSSLTYIGVVEMHIQTPLMRPLNLIVDCGYEYDRKSYRYSMDAKARELLVRAQHDLNVKNCQIMLLADENTELLNELKLSQEGRQQLDNALPPLTSVAPLHNLHTIDEG